MGDADSPVANQHDVKEKIVTVRKGSEWFVLLAAGIAIVGAAWSLMAGEYHAGIWAIFGAAWTFIYYIHVHYLGKEVRQIDQQ